ncbi:MAG: tyrosine--tRNA ligase [Candidatus Westeberhardia cardiocondylae]|nr:tyrosine--tRNA ligase [Candidatus Westeberhardia cardiocondylae]
MKVHNLIKYFEDRGLIFQISNREKLVNFLENNSITLYCGFDPTNDSLHIGHIVLLLCLKRFQLLGHRPIILLGGATALIGDPSFRMYERKLYNFEYIQNNTINIVKQVKRFLNFNCGKNSAIIVNNYDWFKDMNILYFLRNIGKNFSINYMINKKSIKNRLNNIGYGITFTEFSYNILQGYDFSFLYQKYNATLQIGGSDQWGNITSGINLIHRLYSNIVYGLTTPLITRVDGTKFGKNNSGKMLWLDSKKTSIFDFYQFWINVSDNDVYNFLKFFTFIDLMDIMELKKNKNKNVFVKDNILFCKPQYILAKYVTKLVHGKYGLFLAERITKNLFSLNAEKNLTKSVFEQFVQDGIPTVFLKKNNDISLQKSLIITNLAISNREAKNMIESNAISVNFKKQNNKKYVFASNDIKYNHYTLLCRGKKNYRIIYWK